MSKAVEFILLNLYLLAIILAGVASMFVLGSFIMASGISNQSAAGYAIYTAAGIMSIAASYYFGKLTHPVIERFINRKH